MGGIDPWIDSGRFAIGMTPIHVPDLDVEHGNLIGDLIQAGYFQPCEPAAAVVESGATGQDDAASGAWEGQRWDEVVLDYDGRTYELAPDLLDRPGGAVHSHTAGVMIADDNGVCIVSDTDGDGKVDYVSVAANDGNWQAWTLRGEGAATGVGAGVGRGADAGTGKGMEKRAGKDAVTTGVSGNGGKRGEENSVVTPAFPADSWQSTRWECVQWGGERYSG